MDLSESQVIVSNVFRPQKSLNTAILFLVFNRPDTTKQVFEAIRQAKPPRLYVAADGPRKDRKDEVERVAKVREIATAVDWPCEVKTLFRDKNLGCKHAVSGAITWFFEQEEQGIILEDDCLPDDSFFRFCEELLFKYKNEDQIMTISGDNFQHKRRTENSYYFSKYMHCWGWASWRRAWVKYDLKMREWEQLKKENFLSDLFTSKSEQLYWNNIYDHVINKEIDTWDYQWQYSIWKENGVNILPEVNLVSNIGFGEGGTHTGGRDSDSANLKTERLDFPLRHPSQIIPHQKADHYTFEKLYSPNLWHRVKRKTIKLYEKIV